MIQSQAKVTLKNTAFLKKYKETKSYRLVLNRVTVPISIWLVHQLANYPWTKSGEVHVCKQFY